MHIHYVKYYKLIVLISCPTCFSECSPYSKRQHKGIFKCANSFCHCLPENHKHFPQLVGGVHA